MNTNTTSTKIPAYTSDLFGTVLTLTFSNGDVYELDTTKQSAEMNQRAALHGYHQKLIDAAAIARNPNTGATATVADKAAAVREVFNRITGADGSTPMWNKGRTVEGSGNNASLLLRALMQMSGKSKAEIAAFLEPTDKATRKALADSPAVAVVIASLRAATVDKSIDTSAMLSSLGVQVTGEGEDEGDEE